MNAPSQHKQVQMVSLDRAVLCVECETISDSTGEVCMKCGANGTLLALAVALSSDRERTDA